MKNKRKLFIIVIVLVAAIGGIFFYTKSYNKAATKNENVESTKNSLSVNITPITKKTFEKRIVVQGNIEAKIYANVTARLEGTIENIFVDEGDKVIANKTKLFQIDSLKLQKAVDIKKQALAVAECSLRESQANLEQVEAELEKAETDLKRYDKLYKDNVISIDLLEQQQTRYKQTKAQKKHAVSYVDLTKEQKKQAELDLKIAEKDLSDALAIAPITGRISHKYKEIGEMGNTNDPIVRIDDTSIIEVSAFLPAQYYPSIYTDKTVMKVMVSDFNLEEQIISYKSPTIDSKLRTFEVKSIIKNPPDEVAPGAIAEITVIVEKRKGLGVPSDAVQKRNNNDVIFLVENGKAKMVTVETGLETDGWIELIGDQINEGAKVVTTGQYMLDDGTPVSVRKEEGV